MNFNLQIKINPTLDDLKSLEKWLSSEHLTVENSFYNNWSMIEGSYQNNSLITIHYNKSVIGFLTWKSSEIYAEIVLFEIQPSFRKKGVGKLFFKFASDFFIKKNLKAIKLDCSPKSSKYFWEKMGFQKFPKTIYSTSTLVYFKLLVDVIEPSKISKSDNKLEIWNVGSHLIEYENPEWVWDIGNDSHISILIPYDDEWNIRLTKNGEIIKECVVKNFFKNKEITEDDSFLFVEKFDPNLF